MQPIAQTILIFWIVTTKTLTTVLAHNLTQEAALSRFKQIEHISYEIKLVLSEENTDFEGNTTISFRLKPIHTIPSNLSMPPLYIDFEEGIIKKILVNNKEEEIEKIFNGHQISLRRETLLPSDENRIEIFYSHPYSSDGNGLHHFKDPTDGNVYVYTNSEPYNAHRIFPCFDQPDLKATFLATVEAPNNWRIVSNMPEQEIIKTDEKKIWKFPFSPYLSTYIFAIIGGPFSIWENKTEKPLMRLMSRKSLEKYIDPSEWFQISREGMRFYQKQFGIPYPFEKYDQIIVPELNPSAMENAAAVTFSESFIHRSKRTELSRQIRADTILHEMAHMWFGDLITMRWWNGLWLNESFASFMSSWAMSQSSLLQFKEKKSWQNFFENMKRWAYAEDQLTTTHPVELTVEDTSFAESHFDGITYGKGASIIKQLQFFLGEDDFREGIQRYLQKYSYKNTNLNDFIKTLGEASGKNLSSWQKKWIQTSGLNTLKVKWECNKKKISQLSLIQSTLPERAHRTKIGLYYYNSKSTVLDAIETLDVTYDSEQTQVKEAIGKPCPEFIFPNEGDFDYVKIELDPVSLKKTAENLNKINDPLTRQMIWHLFWEQVLDGKMLPQKYADLVLKYLPKENNTLVLSQVLKTLISQSNSKEFLLKFLESNVLRKKYQSLLEDLTQAQMSKSILGSDHQLTWFKAFIDHAFSNKAMKLCLALLKGEKKIKGLSIDSEYRWGLIQALARNANKDALKIIQLESSKDSTDMGKKAAIFAEVSLPEKKRKLSWLNEINATPFNLPVSQLKEAMKGYLLFGQDELIKNDLTKTYFETLLKLSTSQIIEEKEYSKNYSQRMYPAFCDPIIIEHSKQFISSHPELPPSIIKTLKTHIQLDERCVLNRKNSIKGEL